MYSLPIKNNRSFISPGITTNSDPLLVMVVFQPRGRKGFSTPDGWRLKRNPRVLWGLLFPICTQNCPHPCPHCCNNIPSQFRFKAQVQVQQQLVATRGFPPHTSRCIKSVSPTQAPPTFALENKTQQNKTKHIKQKTT